MRTGHGTNAAIAAGYGRRSAHVTASRLLRKAKIQRAIQARHAADPRIMTRVERQQFWTAVAEGRGEFKDAPIGVCVHAATVLGKSQGDFLEQQEIRQDVIFHLSWEDPAAVSALQ
jgi:phage terminase small subunit